MDYIALGQRIRAARRRMDLTQQELAEKINLSTSFIGHIERGTRVLSLDTFVQLCATLDTTPNQLLDICDPHPPALDALTANQRRQLQQLLNCLCAATKGCASS